MSHFDQFLKLKYNMFGGLGSKTSPILENVDISVRRQGLHKMSLMAQQR